MWIIVVGVCALLGPAMGRLVPHTPCPKLFNYFESETFEIFGAMTFDNDFSGTYDIEVNMSIAMDTTKNINIYRKTPDYRIQNGERIEYYVTFPFNHTFPKMTSVMFQGKLYCVGPPEEGSATTLLSKRDIFRTRIVDGLRPATTPAPEATTTTTEAPKVQIQININNNIFSEPGCGTNIDYQPLVLSGTSTRSGEYPWLVAMFYQTKGSYAFRCASTLISKNHVITAAHCLRNIDNTVVDEDQILLVLGKHNIKNWAIRSTIRGVKEYIVHPDYRSPGDADIAMIVLDSPVEFKTTIRPICLWDETAGLDGVVGQSGVVAGWGRDETGREKVDEPRQVNMPIVTQESCLRADERFLRLTSERTFCAGSRTGAAPCTGDSGGGFVIKRNGLWKLRGVVSVALVDAASRTCDAKNYVVFSDVPKYNEWIKQVIKS